MLHAASVFVAVALFDNALVSSLVFSAIDLLGGGLQT